MNRTTYYLSALVALLLLLLAPLSGLAQPTITSDDLLGLIGTNHLVEIDSSSSAITVDLGSPGANQTWDFRSVTLNPVQFGVSFLDPAGTRFAADFPGANLVQQIAFPQQPDAELFVYSEVTGSTLAALGEAAVITVPIDTSLITFESGDITPLPVAFNNTWTTTSADTSGLFPQFAFISIDTTTHVVDAWGTVRLPSGDYDCLRVRADTKEIEQSIAAGQVLSSSTTTRIAYSWVSPGAFIVAEAESMDDEPNPNFTTAISFLRLVSSTGTTANETDAGLPGSTLRLEAYPNPARFGSTVSYHVPQAEHVELAVYDVLGHRVRTLVDVRQRPGNHAVQWKGIDAGGNRVAAGIYLIRLDAGAASTTRTVTLLR